MTTCLQSTEDIYGTTATRHRRDSRHPTNLDEDKMMSTQYRYRVKQQAPAGDAPSSFHKIIEELIDAPTRCIAWQCSTSARSKLNSSSSYHRHQHHSSPIIISSTPCAFQLAHLPTPPLLRPSSAQLSPSMPRNLKLCKKIAAITPTVMKATLPRELRTGKLFHSYSEID